MHVMKQLNILPMHSLGSNKKKTKILDMKESIPGIFNSQVQ